MKRLLPVAAASLLSACEGPHHSDQAVAEGLEVWDAVVRLPAGPGRPAAGYFRLSAPPDRIALTSVSSPSAQRIELHETVLVDGRSSMRPIPRQEVRHQAIWFSPGARHLMILGLDPTLRSGDRMELTFHFERGEPVTAPARIVGAGEDVHH